MADAKRRLSLVSNFVDPRLDEELDDPNISEKERSRKHLIRTILMIIKMVVLLSIWLYFCIVIIIMPPHSVVSKMISLEPNGTTTSVVNDEPVANLVEVAVEGNVNLEYEHALPDHVPSDTGKVDIVIQRVSSSGDKLYATDNWTVYLQSDESASTAKTAKTFKTGNAPDDGGDSSLVVVFMLSDSQSTGLKTSINSQPMDREIGIICGAVILVGLYIFIIWDIVDRTFAALLASTAAIATLALLHCRPDLDTIIEWLDVDTIMLLFGMMILVSILAETGVFDYLAVYAYKVAKGHAWPLIFFLCFFTGILSAFLDNVTMVLLMTPVTIRLCEVMYLRTTTVLISIVVFSNIGGTLTPVGDPPNLIIASNHIVQNSGVNFLTFTLHMFPGVLVSMIVSFFVLRCMLAKRLSTADDAENIRQSIKTWKKAAEKVQPTTATEDQMRQEMLDKVNQLKEQYRRKMNEKTFGLTPVPHFVETLVDLESRYYIRNKLLLVKSAIAMIFAILMFMLHSLPFMRGATLPWTAVLAALLLLILYNPSEMASVMANVEWSTLLFFAALFVLMEALAEMGVIDFVGEHTTAIILSVGAEHRITVALLLMLWISAITSAFVDNIPITTMMIKLTIKLARNEALGLPMTPLVWALAYGACFGGNGTLIGASANVVCAGVAAMHGYKFTFLDFFKIGFPIMIITVIIATVYLLIAHSLFEWH